jgi:hypothetical protein
MPAQEPQQAGQLRLLLRGQQLELLGLRSNERDHRRINPGCPVVRQPGEVASSVPRVRLPLDEAARSEVLESVGHRRGADHRRSRQLHRAHFVRRFGAPQRGEDVEFPTAQVGAPEGGRPERVEPERDAPEPGHDIQRREVDLGQAACPGIHQKVYFVVVAHDDLRVPARGRSSGRIARSVIAGYVVSNDVSVRDWLQSLSPTFTLGKSFDTHGPIGPWLTTDDEIDDPLNLHMRLTVNGEVRQDWPTNDMIYDIYDQIAYLTQVMTLMPGDILATGTPSGIGAPTGRFLKVGDVVRAEIGGLGSLENRVVGAN